MIRRNLNWREVRYYYNHPTRLTILPLSERKPRLACPGCNGKLHRYIHKKIGVILLEEAILGGAVEGERWCDQR